MKKIFTFFAALAMVAGVSAQNVDYAITGFVDDEQNDLTTLNISMTDTLAPNFVVVNNGPDVLATGDSLLIDITISGLELGYTGWSVSELNAYELNEVDLQWIGTITLFDAATMDQYSEYLGGNSFEVCFSARVKNATDGDASNNQSCITVNRGNVGVNEVAADEISVFPNPAVDNITVANAEGAQVSVFDMNGRMVANVAAATANQTISVSNLSEGMYIVRIVDGQNVTTQKVSVVR